VFQERASPFVAHLQAIAQKYPALSYVMPFLRTPSNILRQGAEFLAGWLCDEGGAVWWP
jgi:hypothetical protein